MAGPARQQRGSKADAPHPGEPDGSPGDVRPGQSGRFEAPLDVLGYVLHHLLEGEHPFRTLFLVLGLFGGVTGIIGGLVVIVLHALHGQVPVGAGVVLGVSSFGAITARPALRALQAHLANRPADGDAPAPPRPEGAD